MTSTEVSHQQSFAFNTNWSVTQAVVTIVSFCKTSAGERAIWGGGRSFFWLFSVRKKQEHSLVKSTEITSTQPVKRKVKSVG